jgi:hypothetical protein
MQVRGPLPNLGDDPEVDIIAANEREAGDARNAHVRRR